MPSGAAVTESGRFSRHSAPRAGPGAQVDAAHDPIAVAGDQEAPPSRRECELGTVSAMSTAAARAASVPSAVVRPPTRQPAATTRRPGR